MFKSPVKGLIFPIAAKFGLTVPSMNLWEHRRRFFRQNSARQEEINMKEQENLLETKVKREFLGSSSIPESNLQDFSNESQKSDGKTQKPSVESMLKPTWISWLFLAYLYFVIFFVRPKLDLLSGVPWWSVSPEVVATWLLYNLMLSKAERKKLKEEYDTTIQQRKGISFIEFLEENHPSIFAGIEFSQREIIAALGACYAFTGNKERKSRKEFVYQLRTICQSQKNNNLIVDNIMHYLTKTYPQVFSM